MHKTAENFPDITEAFTIIQFNFIVTHDSRNNYFLIFRNFLKKDQLEISYNRVFFIYIKLFSNKNSHYAANKFQKNYFS